MQEEKKRITAPPSPDEKRTPFTCVKLINPVNNALNVLGGKWRLPIIISLQLGKKRFREISQDLGAISDRMLSKELRFLESQGLITRTVHKSGPLAVEYAITPYGDSLGAVIHSLAVWGDQHACRLSTASVG